MSAPLLQATQYSKAFKFFIILSLFGIFFLCIGFISSRASRFRFSEILVSTSNGSKEIEGQIKRELLSDLGKNLFRISLYDIEKKLLKLAPVESVRLHRSWPSTLLIDAVIRNPVALQFEGNRLWVIGKSAQRIESVKNPPPLPLLIDFESLLSVRMNPEKNKMLSEFFQFLAELPKDEKGSGLELSKISEIRWSPERGIILWSFEMGLEIEVGFEQFTKSWALANQAIIWANERNIALSQIDATYPLRVVVRPKLRLQNSQIGLNLEELVHRKDSGPAAAR